jgi:hypothetical protein
VTIPGGFRRREDGAGLKSIGYVRRALEKQNGERAVETRYFIATIIGVRVFAVSVRGHWQVKNKLRR